MVRTGGTDEKSEQKLSRHMIIADFIIQFLGRRRDDSAIWRRGHSRVSIDIPTHYRLVCGRTRLSASHSCTSLSISPSVQGGTTEQHAVSAVLGPLTWGIYIQTLPFPRGKDLAVPTILPPLRVCPGHGSRSVTVARLALACPRRRGRHTQASAHRPRRTGCVSPETRCPGLPHVPPQAHQV